MKRKSPIKPTGLSLILALIAHALGKNTPNKQYKGEKFSFQTRLGGMSSSDIWVLGLSQGVGKRKL